MSNWNTLTNDTRSLARDSNESLALFLVKRPFNMGIKWYGNAIF